VAWPPAEITGKRICGFDLDRTLHVCQKGVYNAVSSGKLIADVTCLDALQNPNSGMTWLSLGVSFSLLKLRVIFVQGENFSMKRKII
jgi:hypothetical protein